MNLGVFCLIFVRVGEVPILAKQRPLKSYEEINAGLSQDYPSFEYMTRLS